MALIPRWQVMTDSSKALVKRSVITLVVALIGFTLLRAIFPWIARPGHLRLLVPVEADISHGRRGSAGQTKAGLLGSCSQHRGLERLFLFAG